MNDAREKVLAELVDLVVAEWRERGG